MTHRDAAHVEDLVERVLALSPQGHVVVHHDAGATGPLPYGGRGPERVHFSERRRILWGDWSIVERTLQMTRDAIRLVDADWFVIISGEHRPVTDLGQWERATVASGAGRAGGGGRIAAASSVRSDAATRTPTCSSPAASHRWVAMDEPRLGVAHRGIGGLWKLSRSVQPLVAIEYSHRRRTWFFGTPRPRGPLAGWTFYKGTQWIAFNRRAAETVLGTDPAVTAWFSHGHIADETYLQTVLHHAPGLDVRNAVVTFVPEGTAAGGPDAVDGPRRRRPAGGLGLGRGLRPQGRPRRAARRHPGDRRGGRSPPRLSSPRRPAKRWDPLRERA